MKLTAFETDEIREILRQIRMRGTMTPEEWAETMYRLPTGGHFRFSYAPYTRQMFRSLFDPKTIETNYRLYSRGLKSTMVLLALGYVIDQAPRRILSLWPTNSQAEKWSKDILCGELFDTTPCLNFLGTTKGQRKGSQTILHKVFPGGLIDMFGANAPGDMRRAKGSFLYGEEIDAIDETETDEGDQLAIFNKRGDEYPDTIRVFASYPSVVGRSRIDARIAESDENQWLSTCIRCGGEPYVMRRSMVRYEEGRTHEARFECPQCHELLTDRERYSMAHEQGYDNWKPLREFRGRRGFTGNAMLWPHPVDLGKYPGGFLQMLAEQEIAAKKADNPQRAIRVLVNTVDAESFDPASEDERPPDWQSLYDRREDYATLNADGSTSITVPLGALVITAAVDVQKDRLEVLWIAWSRTEESWVLAHEVLTGSTQDERVWLKLEAELGRTFKRADGASMGLSMAFVDAGKWPDWVVALLSRLRTAGSPLRGHVRACRGSSQYPHPIIERRYARIIKQVQGHWIGGDAAKDLIYSRLRRLEPEEGLPTAWQHFPMSVGNSFFEQLTSEKVTITYKAGDEVRRYVNEEQRRNEILDLSVYNLAAFRLRTWPFDQIEAELKQRAEELKGERKVERPVSRANRPAFVMSLE